MKSTDFYQSYTLKNGIRLLHVPKNLPITYCGFAVNTGTRDELEDEYGMAHFVEHMLFKGTTHRKSRNIIDRLETIGGQLDAYTTKEDTFIFATVPTKYTDRAMELLSDILFNSTFPDSEMEKELQVIREEIQSYNDSPSELIYDEFEDLIFANSPLGHNILGKTELLEKFDSKKMETFVNRCYTTDELLFFTMGNMPFEQIVKKAEKYFDVPTTERSFTRPAPGDYASSNIKLNKDTFQTHCLIGNRSYELSHPDRMAQVLLHNILGGPYMSSRLNMAVRERNGLAYTIESSLSTYSDTGVWSIYFGCDPKNTKKCLKLIDKELDKLRTKPIDNRQLLIFQKQIEGAMLISNQNYENQILGISKMYLHTNTCPSNEELFAAIKRVDAEKLMETANRLFDKQQLTQLIYE